MIRLSNGHKFNFMVASGALGFDGRGWFWEKPLVALGIIKPELFTVVLKSLTLLPVKGNLRWFKPWTWLPWSPWSCVRLLPGGAVNKVGLTNPGIMKWLYKADAKLDFKKYRFVASIFGTEKELVLMTKLLNRLDFVAIEVNVSCPNANHDNGTGTIVQAVRAVRKVSKHPILCKVSVDQDYLSIAEQLYGYAEAMSLNSVPWKLFSDKKRSPLKRLENKVGGGGGGVSGKPAQAFNWKAVGVLARHNSLPVIAPSVMSEFDVEYVFGLGADAVSFGTIHLRTPWKPTQIVEKLKARGLHR